MTATTMDWSCACGVSATNVPIHPMTSRDICPAAIASHREHSPCGLTLPEACVSIRAVRQFGTWVVTIGHPAPSIPNPKRRKSNAR